MGLISFSDHLFSDFADIINFKKKLLVNKYLSMTIEIVCKTIKYN